MRAFRTRLALRRLGASAAIACAALAAVLALRAPRAAASLEAPAYRVKGPADAPVTLVEYSDFQCSSCRAAQRPLRELLERHPGRVRLAFRHFPAESAHPWARDAAAAAECAGRQGRFWQLHDELFLRQTLWSGEPDAPRLFRDYAAALGLDMGAFSRCLTEPGTADAVERDRQEGLLLGINATPTFFIEGRRFVGASQLETDGAAELERLLR